MYRGTLRVSENGKYLMEGDRPFFWLGDTAWLMLQKLSLDEIRTYFRNRAEKGFNIILTTLVHKMPAPGDGSGIRDVTDPAYWRFVDSVLELSREMGLYLGLLPAWGSFVKSGILNMENIETYAGFLGRRWRGRENIVWVLGGDVRGDAGFDVFCREAEILKSFDPGRLMAFHPFGRTSSSLWFQEREWLDIDLFQSGHRRYDQSRLGQWDDNKNTEEFFGEDNWRYVLRDHAYPTKKPTLDGEPSYEGIPQGLHDPHEPYWEEWDARRYAYWSVFAGAAGHTYGHNAVMQFHASPEKPGAYGVRETWREALHAPGSSQLGHLKGLMESVDFMNGVPRDGLLLSGQRERYHRVSVFAGEDYIFCYDYSGDGFELDLGEYSHMAMDAWWMDPRNGTLSYFDTLRGQERRFFRPTARKSGANDWVLVLKKAP